MESFCGEHTQMREDLGAIKAGVESIKEAMNRLDIRINGSFKAIGEHISEAPDYRSKINVMDTELRLFKDDVGKKFKDAKEERLNTVKASQWRIGLIVALVPTTVAIILHFWK